MSLTKREAMLGRQCEKALWLERRQPELKTPYTEADLLRFEQGNIVDLEARLHYPGGAEVPASEWGDALQTTRALIDEGHTRLYQAAFEHDDLRIRTDVLDLHDDGACSLREVKMSTSKKDEHALDVAIQLYVLEANGMPVREACLVLVDGEYVAGGASPLFVEHDVTDNARALAGQIGADLSRFKSTLEQEDVPDIAIGPHCTKPWPCPFQAHCWQDVPEDSIFTIPRLHASKKNLLIDQGILRVKDVPDDFPLTAIQNAYVSAQKSGEDTTDKTFIRNELEKLDAPFYFLDFETYGAPLPPWPGVRPNEQVPFQFSCHRLEPDGTLSHCDFLHPVFEDPRRPVAEALLEWIGDAGAIMVYHAAFEKKVLEGLAGHLPDYAAQLNRLIERLFDQLVLVKQHVHHPGLLGSNSLKRVSSVLLRDRIDYSALEIAEGASAQAGWYKMTQMPEEDRAPLMEALIEYCRLDTLAQVELHRWFMSGG